MQVKELAVRTSRPSSRRTEERCLTTVMREVLVGPTRKSRKPLKTKKKGENVVHEKADKSCCLLRMRKRKLPKHEIKKRVGSSKDTDLMEMID